MMNLYMILGFAGILLLQSRLFFFYRLLFYNNFLRLKNCLIIQGSRTFSKIYGLAGLRIGYAVAKPDLIKKLAKNQLGTILNQAAIAAAKASLGDDEFMSYTRKMNAEARTYFTLFQTAPFRRGSVPYGFAVSCRYPDPHTTSC